MKLLKYILLLTIIVSCDNNDDTVTSTNIFTVGTQVYETPNCYIEFDEITDNEANFNLFFLDGRMYDNDLNVNGSSGDYLFSLNTTNFVFYNIRAIENPLIEVPQYPNIQTGIPYKGSDNNSVIIHNFSIDTLSTNFNTNGFDFGTPNQTTGTIHEPMLGNTKTITINSYTFNVATQTGTIDADYSFLSQNGVVITGHYDGNLGVFLD